MNSGEKIRDYRHEYELRKKRKIQHIFELDIKQSKELKNFLDKNNMSLVQWIKNQLKEMEI